MTAVDFSDPQLVDDYLDLLDAYARDPMGGGVGLTDAVRTRLPIDLAGAAEIAKRSRGTPRIAGRLLR